MGTICYPSLNICHGPHRNYSSRNPYLFYYLKILNYMFLDYPSFKCAMIIIEENTLYKC